MPINGPLRLPGSFTSPGTSLTVNNADTVGLTLTHFFTDHIAVTSVLGVPPEFTLTGHGSIRPPGPAGALGSVNMDNPANQPAVKNARQWARRSFCSTTSIRRRRGSARSSGSAWPTAGSATSN